MYFGGAAEYRIDTALGTILVSVPSPNPATLLAPGAKVTISVDPELAYLLPASEAASAAAASDASAA